MNIERLSLDQLRVFAQVADSGSFLAAAKALKRAQSAVSYAISTLESQLGLPLFDRGSYRPQLTAAGIELLRDARQVLDQVDALQARAAAYSQGGSWNYPGVRHVFPTTALVALQPDFAGFRCHGALEISAGRSRTRTRRRGDAGRARHFADRTAICCTSVCRRAAGRRNCAGPCAAQIRSHIPGHVLERVQLVLNHRCALRQPGFLGAFLLAWRMTISAQARPAAPAWAGAYAAPCHRRRPGQQPAGAIVTAAIRPSAALPVYAVPAGSRSARAAWWLDALG